MRGFAACSTGEVAARASELLMSDSACQTRQAQQMFRRFHKNRFSRSSTSKPDSVVRRDSPLNRPHPSPHLAEMGVRSAHARARAEHARAPWMDTGQGPNVWYVVVCMYWRRRASRAAPPAEGRTCRSCLGSRREGALGVPSADETRFRQLRHPASRQLRRNCQRAFPPNGDELCYLQDNQERILLQLPHGVTS